jgi:hypothetical protein
MANASVGPFRERGFAGCMPLTGYVTLGCPVQRADSVHGPWPDKAVDRCSGAHSFEKTYYFSNFAKGFSGSGAGRSLYEG